MIPHNLTTYAKNGVTSVTRVTEDQSQAQQGFARNTSGGLPSHRHTDDDSRAGESVTPEISSKTGVTKRCDAESLTDIASPGCVTPVTPVTPKNEYVADNCGGAFLPWCAPISPAQVAAWQAELLELIEKVADSECWSHAALDEVVTRAVRGPLSDLRPNLGYFRERIAEIEAERRARQLIASRTWRAGKDFDDRRGTQ